MTFKDLTRRRFIADGASAALATGAALATPAIVRAEARPNILFVAVDDLNDWIEPLGGYVGVRTPNFRRLAAITRLFERAYTSAPACSAARSSTLFGVQPFHSGVYTNNEAWQTGSRLVGQTSAPQFFKNQGYFTVGTGKVFHDGWRGRDDFGRTNGPATWDDYEFCQSRADGCELPDNQEVEGGDDMVELTKSFAFGPADVTTAEMADTVRARWFVQNVLSKRHDRPFFGAIGIQKPHLPFTVPDKWFDLYDPADIRYPPGVLDPTHNTLQTNRDVADLPRAGIEMLKQFGKRDHANVTGGETNLWKDVIRAYLAAISFADHTLGLVLDGWLKGPNAGNTVIVVWSDHGWQLGEKMGWRKFTLWERATRVPYLIGGEVGGRTIEAGRSALLTSTLGLFPTLSDLAFGAVPRASDLGGLPLDGVSSRDHLLGRAGRSDPVLSTWALNVGEGEDGPGARHFSVRSDRHRLIAYGNGDRELYDHKIDPYEFDNLFASAPDDARRLARPLEALLPAASECAPRAG